MIVHLVSILEYAKLLDIQKYFDVLTIFLDNLTFTKQKKITNFFMREILEMFLRKKDKNEVSEWRESARRLQKLADHNIPLRRWLIKNKRKWEWLPRYYTLTRAPAAATA
jgi:hypothetical protein